MIGSIFDISKPTQPVLYLVTEGGDPTQTIDDFAKKKKAAFLEIVSMG
jgi:hypothetical protein